MPCAGQGPGSVNARPRAGRSRQPLCTRVGALTLREARATGVSVSIGICPEVFSLAHKEILNQNLFPTCRQPPVQSLRSCFEALKSLHKIK